MKFRRHSIFVDTPHVRLLGLVGEVHHAHIQRCVLNQNWGPQRIWTLQDFNGSCVAGTEGPHLPLFVIGQVDSPTFSYEQINTPSNKSCPTTTGSGDTSGFTHRTLLINDPRIWVTMPRVITFLGGSRLAGRFRARATSCSNVAPALRSSQMRLPAQFLHGGQENRSPPPW